MLLNKISYLFKKVDQFLSRKSKVISSIASLVTIIVGLFALVPLQTFLVAALFGSVSIVSFDSSNNLIVSNSSNKPALLHSTNVTYDFGGKILNLGTTTILSMPHGTSLEPRSIASIATVHAFVEGWFIDKSENWNNHLYASFSAQEKCHEFVIYSLNNPQLDTIIETYRMNNRQIGTSSVEISVDYIQDDTIKTAAISGMILVKNICEPQL